MRTRLYVIAILETSAVLTLDEQMVLDAGQLAEFDKPSELLKKEKGLLKALVDESGDKEHLYSMANAAAQEH